MKVTANKLLNYIRCRRYASLNDPDSDYSSVESSNQYLSKFADIFENVFDFPNDIVEKNVQYSYDFHQDITLSEIYNYIVSYPNHKDIYLFIPVSSSGLKKIEYSYANKNYSIFIKKEEFKYKLNKIDKDKSSNYHNRIAKLTNRLEDSGRIIYQYAFKRFLYDIVNPENKDRIYIVLLNNNYCYDGLKYTKDLFDVFDFTGLYSYFDDQIEADIYRMINHIELNDFTPCALVKKECRLHDSFECKFTDFCFSHLPKENSILDYFHANTGFTEPNPDGDIYHETYNLINQGMVDMDDVPISWLKDEKHLMQRYCVDNNFVYVNKQKIELLLKTLKYPLIYLDFEALPAMIPRYKGEKPFMQSVFQYSIHFEYKEGVLAKNGPNHFEFLANPSFDNRKELVKSLIALIDKYNSSVIVYHKTFEEQRLKEFQKIFPEYHEKLENIINRLFDLEDVLKNNKRFYKKHGYSDEEASRYNFYSAKLCGSYSLKKVIKVFNKVAYKNLNINNGIKAYKAYMSLGKLNSVDRDKTEIDLLEYCKQDTFSMFEIINGIKKYLSDDFTIT